MLIKRTNCGLSHGYAMFINNCVVNIYVNTMPNILLIQSYTQNKSKQIIIQASS